MCERWDLRAAVFADHVNRLGWTALHEAVVLGDGGPRYVDTVRLLIAAGANPSLLDGDGVNAAPAGDFRGYDEIAAHLRKAGVR